MNKQMIRYVLGLVLLIEGALLLLPLAVALLYQETTWKHFGLTIAVCLILGGCMIIRKPRRRTLFPKDGFVIAALTWIVISLVGALPFSLSGQIPRYIDALFEVISGFTTTGSSILPRVEALDKGMLFWRSFSHWIGGMGILVFMLALLPAMGGATIHILRAESPGPNVAKVVPKIRESAKITYLIYLALTLLLVILYLAGGMPLFDSLCIAFGTAGTGGFAVRTSSCAEYTPYIQTVTTIFMALFGVNFTVYFLLLQRKFRQALHSSELWTYVGIILTATLAISVNIYRSMPSFGQAVHHAAFTVSSIITTTGYGTLDFNLWPGDSLLSHDRGSLRRLHRRRLQSLPDCHPVQVCKKRTGAADPSPDRQGGEGGRQTGLQGNGPWRPGLYPVLHPHCHGFHAFGIPG